MFHENSDAVTLTPPRVIVNGPVPPVPFTMVALYASMAVAFQKLESGPPINAVPRGMRSLEVWGVVGMVYVVVLETLK